MEFLPELGRDREVQRLKEETENRPPPPPEKGETLPRYVAPPGVAPVGFEAGRTPVDTSSRLLASYLSTAEPAFCVATPGYQAQRLGTLASEAPHPREMGPVAPVQGLMYSRYNCAARYAQSTKNLSIGRNRAGRDYTAVQI